MFDCELARAHKVRPWAYERWGLKELEGEVRGIAVRNLAVTGELLRVIGVLEGFRIPVMALKGPVLAQMLYGDVTMREFGDLDLLVREGDWVRAGEALREAGYRPGWDIDGGLKKDFLRYQGEAWFAKDSGQALIDLHWRAAPKNAALVVDAEGLWERARPVEIAGRRVMAPAVEDLPLYLASQGGQEGWSDLRRVCDLAALVERYPELDWGRVFAEATRLKGLRVVSVGLYLAASLFGARIPDVAFDGAVKRLAEGWDERRGGLGSLVFRVQAKEGLWEKARLAAGILTDRTDSDGHWLMLPRAMWGAYRVLRPVRMGWLMACGAD